MFDQDTVEGWVGVQLQHSGRYRSWMSYIRDFGRWLSMHGATDAYVLSESWKAPILALSASVGQGVRSSYSSPPQHNCRFNRRGDGKRSRSR